MTSREMCRRVTAGTVSYRAVLPGGPDPGPGEPVVAVAAGRSMGGLMFTAGWITRPGRHRWRLAVWVQASTATGPQRVPGTCWGIQQALHTAAVCHQAAMAALYAEYEARREQR
jgi:hypothetical protein